MHGSGVRGGGGGFHHHHHHMGVGGALVAGAVIGAAASRNRQPDVVVVQPAYGQPYGQPTYAYGQPTTVYATPPVQQTVYVQPTPAPPRRRRNPAVFCIICSFLLAIVLCLALIPWPGVFSQTLISGSQRLNAVDGNFIERVTTTGDDAVTLYALTSRPPISQSRDYVRALTFKPGYRAYDYMQFYLLAGSTVNANWNYVDTCRLQFIVLQGASRMATFANGGYPASIVWTDIYQGTGSYPVTAHDTDDYYFIFYNPTSCAVTSNLNIADFDVHATAYDTSSAFQTCTADACTIDVPYPQYVFLVLEAPTALPTTGSYYIVYTVSGRWYTYTALYLGLFLGMCICAVIAAAGAQRKQHQHEEEQASLITGAATNYHTETPTGYAAPPPYAPDSR